MYFCCSLILTTVYCFIFKIQLSQFTHSAVDGDCIVSRFYYYKYSCACLLIHIYNISLITCRKYLVTDSGHRCSNSQCKVKEFYKEAVQIYNPTRGV